MGASRKIMKVKLDNFFNEYGFVVIKGALTVEESDKGSNDLWTYIHL